MKLLTCIPIVAFVLHSSPGSAALPLTTATVHWAQEAFSQQALAQSASASALPADFWPGPQPPFSFVYDGKASSTLLKSWTREAERRSAADREQYRVHWTDPVTGLKVSASATAFKDFPAVEWVLSFENTGQQDTPILENVQALDVMLQASPKQSLVLDQINGDDCSPHSFAPTEREVKPGEQAAFAPEGGRPSTGAFPFFNLERDRQGFFVAIGWTGQWAASLRRDTNGTARLQAGMELTHLRLHPGESIRTPRILLLRWSGERVEAHNQFRRLLLAHYLPRLNGRPVQLAIAAQTFNRFAGGARPNWATEAGQIAAAKVNRALGCDTLWFDAGWFEGNFPDGVGNWFPKRREFPRGLSPVGEACEKLGLKFLVWYEPERVARGTQLGREHPDFVLPTNQPPGAEGLFDLGNPRARRWLTDLLVQQIRDFHIHTYRNDFNISPLSFWRQNDAPDRQGITVIRYVEGLYAMWDEMRAKFPQMYLDDCASGGRRIDLEMVMRSVVQTRSDSACAPGRAEWDQAQSYGLNLYLPLHATIGWEVGAYPCRSSAAAGFCAEWDILDPQFPLAQARACIQEIAANRPYWTGDYYPLTPWTLEPGAWMAWQLHRPDLDSGIVLAFRRQGSSYSALQVKLRGLKPRQKYRVQFINDQHHAVTRTMKGSELSALELRLPARHSSVLVRYAPK